MHILNKHFDKIFVITLEGSSRMEKMINRLKGIEYEFFYGVNGATLDKTPYIEMGSKQTRGQLGCTLSHYKIYEKMVSENIDKVLILEDDCLFNDNLNNLDTYMEQLPEDWGLFYVGWDNNISLPKNFTENLCELSNKFIIAIEGTQSIAVRPHYAKRLLELNKQSHYTADGLLTESIKQYGLKAYVSVPKISKQDGLGSITCDIDRIYGH